MRRIIVCAALLLSASAVRADGVPPPPTPLHMPPVPEQMIPPPRALSPWDTLVEPRAPLPVLPVVSTPEPASAALLGMALLALGWRRR